MSSAYEFSPVGYKDLKDRDLQSTREQILIIGGARPAPVSDFPLPGKNSLSSWSRSKRKRIFDFGCVLCALPLLIPIYLVVGLAVWMTSDGPVLFLQRRMGRNGQPFTILKFRTMMHRHGLHRSTITTASDQRLTPVGAFLRRWKLDELPQLLNVLAGQMSLVGPRPKVPEQVSARMVCRPGVTGAATVVFAREERILDRIPAQQLSDYYNNVVLPVKRNLDTDYMARATFLSDIRIIVNSVLRHWDNYQMARLLRQKTIEVQGKALRTKIAAEREVHVMVPLIAHSLQSAPPDGDMAV